jgi:hypothetical protein
MIAEVTIDIDDAFNSLNYMEQAECVSNFYDALPYDNQKKQLIAQIIEDADDDVLIDELEHRGYNVKKDD